MALDELNVDDKEISLMRHHEQLSNSDVAQALELTIAAARMRYLRALHRLRTVLETDSNENPQQSS